MEENGKFLYHQQSCIHSPNTLYSTLLFFKNSYFVLPVKAQGKNLLCGAKVMLKIRVGVEEPEPELHRHTLPYKKGTRPLYQKKLIKLVEWKKRIIKKNKLFWSITGLTSSSSVWNIRATADLSIDSPPPPTEPHLADRHRRSGRRCGTPPPPSSTAKGRPQSRKCHLGM
jgi:hypothetical protein